MIPDPDLVFCPYGSRIQGSLDTIPEVLEKAGIEINGTPLSKET
jgi:hypothetical protein